MTKHSSLNLVDSVDNHTGWCGQVYRMVEDVDGWWFDVDLFSESEQAINQSTLRKPAQPHKSKELNPNFEIFEGFRAILNGLSVYYYFQDNLDVILTILHLSMIEHSTEISVGPSCVTIWKLWVETALKTESKNPSFQPSSINSSVSAMS